MSNNNGKLSKKDKYKIAYIAIYVILLSALIIFSIMNPSFMGDVGLLMEKLKIAFGLFA